MLNIVNIDSMFKFYGLIVLSVYVFIGNAQERVYFDKQDKQLKSEKGASYYRIYGENGDFKDYFLTGELWTVGNFSDVKAQKLDGCITWYTKDGRVDAYQCYEEGIYLPPVVTEKHKATAWKNECDGCEFPRDEKGRIEWTGVVEHPGSADDLYQKAFYVLSDFEDLGQIENKIERNDDQKKVSRRFSFDLYYGMHSSHVADHKQYQKRGYMVFEFAIYCKDDKYKYRVHDFKMVPLDNTGAYSLESVYEASDDFGMGLIGKNKEQITTQVLSMINGYYNKDQELIGYIELITRKMSGMLSALERKHSGQDLIDDDW